MSGFFERSKDNAGIVTLKFDRKDMEANVLSEAVLRELNDHLDQIAADNAAKGLVIISGKSGQFIAGADITEIAKFKSAGAAQEGSSTMQKLLGKISTLHIPSVAAINGACLGGGLELALSCTWRIISDDDSTALAVPEIQLGLIPGAGGTQRLPRLVGIQAGLDMVLTGKRIKGKKAVSMGLADAIVSPDILHDIAKQYAVKKTRPVRKRNFVTWLLEGTPFGRAFVHKKAREMVDKNTKGFYPAAYKALEAVFSGFDGSLAKGLDLEAKLFGELVMTKESQSLIHLFHATTKLKKNLDKDVLQKRFGGRKASTIGVIGCGFMGAGIATVCADKNYRVLLSDPNKEVVGRAMKHFSDYFKKQEKRKRLKRFEVDQKISHISPGLDVQGFQRCDVVVEAVFEDLKLKQRILQDFEARSGDDVIFASNTSALPIKSIASASKRPQNIIGMHFFSPVEKMPLLEIIVTDQTADWVTSRCVEVGQKMGKQVIVVKDGPGFYTTRALAFYLNEATLMLSEGARIDKLDKALTDFGFPVGPITLIDEVGIDVGSHVLSTMASSFGDRVKVPEGMKIVLDSGRLGRKNNKGFYQYKEGKKGGPDEGIYQMLAEFKVAPKGIPADEIVDRCLLIFVNESLRCLEEGILLSAHDGDVGAVFGLGFPPFWGGPFRYIDHLGARIVLERLENLTEKYGARFKPAELLRKYAAENKRFFPEEAH